MKSRKSAIRPLGRGARPQVDPGKRKAMTTMKTMKIMKTMKSRKIKKAMKLMIHLPGGGGPP